MIVSKEICFYIYLKCTQKKFPTSLKSGEIFLTIVFFKSGFEDLMKLKLKKLNRVYKVNLSKLNTIFFFRNILSFTSYYNLR